MTQSGNTYPDGDGAVSTADSTASVWHRLWKQL